MSKYMTIVIRLPEKKPAGPAGIEIRHSFVDIFQIGNEINGGVITAMSLEDEMTVLELIEQHDDFEPHIAEDARAKADELHKVAEAAPA